MNRVDKEFEKVVLETVRELLTASTEEYSKIRLVFLSLQTDDEKINEYLHKLIAYTDRHRPLPIEKKEAQNSGQRSSV